MSDETRGFWQSPCPARGAGLTHSHWSKCGEDGHPDDGTTSSGHQHEPWMCCHCEKTEAMYRAEVYAEAEIAMLQGDAVNGTAACTQPHEKLQTKRIIVEEGVQWATCPSCGMQAEGKMATGKAEGSVIGRGRGELTKRQMAALVLVDNNERFLDWVAKQQ